VAMVACKIDAAVAIAISKKILLSWEWRPILKLS
jgi:hypothetical protein